MKYLLGILNSSILNFYFINTAKPKDNGFFESNKQFIAPLPIKMPEDKSQILIESKVTQILNLKKADTEADTSALEAEIDQLVYELYGLTDQEIKIVEASVK